MPNEDLPKLLRASAGGTQAQENRHDIILNAAADEIEKLRRVSADLLEAAQLLEAAELGRQNCEECDGGEGEPEACGNCFPKFDDARIKRRIAIAKATVAGTR